MKIKTILLLFGISNICYSQSDFRNVKWGMSIQEVKNSESTPLTEEGKKLTGYNNGKPQYDGEELVFDNATVTGKKASVYYDFKNGRLIECRVIFRNSQYSSYDKGMSEVIPQFDELFEALKRKKMSISQPLQSTGSDGSVYYDNQYNKMIQDLMTDKSNWAITPKVLELVDAMLNENSYPIISFRLSNSRSNCIVSFWTKHKRDMRDVSPIVVVMKPTFEVIKKIEDSEF